MRKVGESRLRWRRSSFTAQKARCCSPDLGSDMVVFQCQWSGRIPDSLHEASRAVEDPEAGGSCSINGCAVEGPDTDTDARLVRQYPNHGVIRQSTATDSGFRPARLLTALGRIPISLEVNLRCRRCCRRRRCRQRSSLRSLMSWPEIRRSSST